MYSKEKFCLNCKKKTTFIYDFEQEDYFCEECREYEQDIEISAIEEY